MIFSSAPRRGPDLRADILPSGNTGTAITALLPALFAIMEPPGSSNIPLTIGAITFGVTIIAAVLAWSARETYRVHLNGLGEPDAGPVAKADHDRMRARTLADARG